MPKKSLLNLVSSANWQENTNLSCLNAVSLLVEHASAASGVILQDWKPFHLLLKSPVLVLRASVGKVRIGNSGVLAVLHKEEYKRGL